MHGVEWIVDAEGCDAAVLRDQAKLAALFDRLIADLRLTPEERRQMNEALARIESSENDSEAGIYFLLSHPLTRVLNQVQLRNGIPPGNVVDMTSEEWSTYRSNMGRRVVDSLRWASLSGRR